MLGAVLALSGLRCWAATLATESGVSISHHSLRFDTPSRLAQHWVELFGEDEKVNLAREWIQRQTVSSEIARVRRGEAFGVVVNSGCPLANAATNLICQITSHRVWPDGYSELEAIATSRNTIKKLMKTLIARDIGVRLLELGPVIVSKGLTSRQEQRELARACGLSSSTLAEVLRRGERNLVGMHEAGVGFRRASSGEDSYSKPSQHNIRRVTRR
jgi:lambda repressor-like predicted transcriptional regulator